MKSVLTIILLFVSMSLYAQYYSYETTIICPANKKEMAMEGFKNMKQVFKEMVKDEKLLNFDSWFEDKKDTIHIVYVLTAESDSSFKKIMRDSRKRWSEKDPTFSTTFWKTCTKTKEQQADKLALLFPVIKSERGVQVVAVEALDEKPDPKIGYNILVDLTSFSQLGNNKFKVDSSSTNWGLFNIGRIMNLHVAAGIPKNKLDFVVAVHGMAINSFLTNEAYKKKFSIDNPNLLLINELTNAGVKFLVCGQSISWMGIERSKLSDKVKVALSAQTVLTAYQMKGYALKGMSND
jgi:intracellular sulfur oxidation DsrE/DsrF family protein